MFIRHCDTCPLAEFFDNLGNDQKSLIRRQVEVAADVAIALSGNFGDASTAMLDVANDRSEGLALQTRIDDLSTSAEVDLKDPALVLALGGCKREVYNSRCAMFSTSE